MKLFAISLMFVACFCILIGLIQNVVNTDHGGIYPTDRNIIHLNGDDVNLWWFVQLVTMFQRKSEANKETISDIFQLSDIHVSKFQDPKRPEDLAKFCQHHLPKIAPELFIVTGDLTDAKYKNERGSTQFIEEWKRYEEVITLCQKYNNNVKWLDVRGNHDAFNVPDLDHKKNLFRTYSGQGKTNPSSYKYTHKLKFGEYSFIAMDATPNPGPRRPFNFIGILRENQINLLNKMSLESSSSNMTFWFGHYPTSLIITEDGSNIHQLMRNASAYFCGHLHLSGLHTRHKTGTYELELGDWKHNRMYRIVAVDSNVMAFSDQAFHEEPVIIFTNPQHARFPAPQKVTSTHIRLLIFPPSHTLTVDLYIDKVKIGEAQNVKGPLYVLPWKPEQFKSGLHHITAVVKENGFTIKEKSQLFSLDGTTEPFPILARIVLMVDLLFIGKLLFYFLAVVYVLVLCLLRKCADLRSLKLQGDALPGRFIKNFINRWIRRVWLVSKATKIFLILTCFTTYIMIGPWFMAEVIDGHIGLMFVWGLYVKGALLPGSLTYVYGIFQMVSYNIPLLFHLGYILDYPQSFSESNQLRLSHRIRHLYIPMIVLLIFQCYVTLIEFPQAYGTKAIILGPVRSGSIFIGMYCYYAAFTHHYKSTVHTS